MLFCFFISLFLLSLFPSSLHCMFFALQVQPVFFQHHCIELLVPDPAAVKEAYQKGIIPFPYWSQVWPAAKALAQFLLDHPTYTKAKRVVELGAGLGLPSLVAARNAAQVVCTDIAPEAVAIASKSAAHLQLQNFSSQVINWQQLPDNLEMDVLLLSDVNYEPAAFQTLLKIIDVFLEKKITILLSTPQRLMAKEFIAPLLAACTYQQEIIIQHWGKDVSTTVMVLEQK